MFDSNSGIAAAAASRRLGARHGPGERAAHLLDRARAPRVGALDVGLGLEVGVREDRDRVLEVVEDDEHVGEHQRHVGQPERVRAGLAERLDRAHEVVAEEADRAAGERRRVAAIGACSKRPTRSAASA